MAFSAIAVSTATSSAQRTRSAVGDAFGVAILAGAASGNEPYRVSVDYVSVTVTYWEEIPA